MYNKADNFRHYITFDSLCNVIQNKKKVSKNSRTYAGWAKEFFEDVSKSIESMLNPPEEGGYYFMEPPIKEVFARCGKDISRMSAGEINEMGQNFQVISNNLEEMMQDEAVFYETPKAKETSDFLSKLIPKNIGFCAYDLFGDFNSEED
jgi:hypothetical protein